MKSPDELDIIRRDADDAAGILARNLDFKMFLAVKEYRDRGEEIFLKSAVPPEAAKFLGAALQVGLMFAMIRLLETEGSGN